MRLTAWILMRVRAFVQVLLVRGVSCTFSRLSTDSLQLRVLPHCHRPWRPMVYKWTGLPLEENSLFHTETEYLAPPVAPFLNRIQPNANEFTRRRLFTVNWVVLQAPRFVMHICRIWRHNKIDTIWTAIKHDLWIIMKWHTSDLKLLETKFKL